MSEDTNPQGTEAEIESRLNAVEEAPEAEVETEESGEVMPASEQEAEQGDEVTEPTEEVEEEPSLPEGASERTRKEFERLTEHNRKLKEQLDQREKALKGTSVFDNLYGREPVPQDVRQATDARNYQNLDQRQVNDVATQFIQVDPETGEKAVDVEGLVNALEQRNQQSVAEAENRIRTYEESRQVAEAHSQHPYLDPQNEQFDPVFFDMVRLKALDNLVHRGGKTLNQMAEETLQAYTPKTAKPNVAKERNEAVEAYKRSQDVRRQAQPAVRGRGATRQTTHSLEELRARTQSADIHDSDRAISERLKNAE